MRQLREMVSLSLMQQQSASDRLKGVSWTGQLDRPSGEVVAALLDALMHDPNVNVRLATIDALERFASREDVRRDDRSGGSPDVSARADCAHRLPGQNQRAAVCADTKAPR
jgi:hypothetical protein